MVVIKGIDRNGNIIQMQTNDRDRAAKFIAMLDKYYYDEPLPDEPTGVKICDSSQATPLASLHQDEYLGGVRTVPINEGWVMPSLCCSSIDMLKILDISDRYLTAKIGKEPTSDARVGISMSLVSCHARGTPLDLDGLLAANQEDLEQDVEGIVDNINIKTGELENGWLPQYTLKEEVNFCAPLEDMKKIAAIADRFIAESVYDWGGDERLHIMMSLTACHMNGTPLDLDGLLNAQSVDLSHDVNGICSNINTTTGKLDNHFLPRYTLKEEACDA